MADTFCFPLRFVFVSQLNFIVEAGHSAVMFNRLTGVSPKVIGEGTHFKLPWFQIPQVFDIRAHAHQIPTRTGSKGFLA